MLRDVIPQAAQRFGDTAALVDGEGRPVSYVDLHHRSEEVAAGLAREGLGPGAVIGLSLPATPSTWWPTWPRPRSARPPPG